MSKIYHVSATALALLLAAAGIATVASGISELDKGGSARTRDGPSEPLRLGMRAPNVPVGPAPLAACELGDYPNGH